MAAYPHPLSRALPPPPWRPPARPPAAGPAAAAPRRASQPPPPHSPDRKRGSPGSVVPPRRARGRAHRRHTCARPGAPRPPRPARPRGAGRLAVPRYEVRSHTHRAHFECRFPAKFPEARAGPVRTPRRDNPSAPRWPKMGSETKKATGSSTSAHGISVSGERRYNPTDEFEFARPAGFDVSISRRRICSSEAERLQLEAEGAPHPPREQPCRAPAKRSAGNAHMRRVCRCVPMPRARLRGGRRERAWQCAHRARDESHKSRRPRRGCGEPSLGRARQQQRGMHITGPRQR